MLSLEVLSVNSSLCYHLIYYVVHQVGKRLANPAHYPSSGPKEMGEKGINVSTNAFVSKTTELANHNYLLGQKVRTRFPNDKFLFLAVICGNNPVWLVRLLVFKRKTFSQCSLMALTIDSFRNFTLFHLTLLRVMITSNGLISQRYN